MLAWHGRGHRVISTIDLSYSRVDGVDLYADIHRPDVEHPVPTVLHFHGGGWATGDRKDFLETRILPLTAVGVAVVSVDYRLTDVAPFPAQLLDARAAVQWVKAVGPMHGLAVARIGSWGSSAGGTLAALLGLASSIDDKGNLLDAPLLPVTQAVVTWGGAPLDLPSMFSRSWLEAKEMPAAGSEAALLLGSSNYELNDPYHRAANPLGLVSADAAPFLLVTGDRDHLVSASTSLRTHDRLTEAGVESSVLILGGGGHEGTEHERSLVIRATAEHFINHLGPSSAQ